MSTERNEPQEPTQEVPAIMLPWADWKDPEVVNTDLHSIFTTIDESRVITVNQRDGEGNSEPIGIATETALRDLSTRVGFTIDFVKKLSPELQVAVINDRVNAARKQKFSFVRDEDGFIGSAAPGWREATSHRQIAQLTYDTLLGLENIDSVQVARADRGDGGMTLKLLTPTQRPVTPQVGDALSLGLMVEHNFGTKLQVSLFTERLVCLNGMTSDVRDYSWTNDAAGTTGRQREWLQERIGEIVDQYDLLISHARKMAETVVTGDMTSALYMRARAMRIPARHMPEVLMSYNMEPGNTEWHLLNAITRFATHTAQPGLGRRLQRAAGTVVDEYTMCKAWLPHHIAQQIGARIDQVDGVDLEDAAVLATA